MKKLLLALGAASMALTATPALAKPHHGKHEVHRDRGHHYGQRYNYRVYNYRYQPYYYGPYWRYNGYYHCRKTNGGIGVLVDYYGNLVFVIRDSRVICR